MCNIVLPFNYLGRVFFRSAVLVPVQESRAAGEKAIITL